jgi:WD40 repeat protein
MPRPLDHLAPPTSQPSLLCRYARCSSLARCTQLWIFEGERKQWQRSRAFAPSRCHADCVRSVSWAADMGRSFQLIATGSRDRTVKLWALQRARADEHGGGAPAEPDGSGPQGGEHSSAWSAPCCAELVHRSQVWRVQWNASGSMLATSEDDGSVQCFRQDANGSWRHAEPMRFPA